MKLEGTLVLIGLTLKRDWLRLTIWFLSLVLVQAATALSFPGLYTNETERQQLAETMINPAMTALVGPGYGLDNYHYGAMMGHQMLAMSALVMAVMSILLIIRYTRTEEETGRMEIVRSLPAGALAPAASGTVVVFVLNLLIGAGTAVSLGVMGLEGQTWTGSIVYGGALAAAGIFFLGLGLLTAQLSSSARGASGLAMGLMTLFYTVRAVGDVGGGAWSWLSPFGWIVKSEAYVSNIVWPLLLTTAASVILLGAAGWLFNRRDIGSGVLPPREGKAEAGPLLRSPFALALRLQRTSLIIWALVLLLLGAMYGSILGDTDAYFADIEFMKEFMDQMAGVSMTDQFVSLLFVVLSIMATVPALLSTTKLRAEENNQRAEAVLTRPVSRWRLFGSYAVLTVSATVLFTAASSAGLAGAAAAVIEDGRPFQDYFLAGIAYVPAVWVMASASALLLAVRPAFVSWIWGYVTASFVIVYMGGLFQFPAWTEKLTPYGYVPRMPVEEVELLPLILLTAVAAAVYAAAFFLYRNRDLQ
ncbi:ABC transporter permease [Alkalicoccus urumqiensis]|uniref:ABC transporter permease n=1 Tax=Alkalicoccus urumqiensis TaxID=1548213 RepID=A0A2P6MJD4_ALKUR|nr:ABC transporter permease [Alkalicoccus urumqiensis]PRO66370.1 ABC transporter permease [Alkalicoccus urumqiensis]